MAMVGEMVHVSNTKGGREPRPYLSGYFIIRVTKVRGPRSSGSEFRGEHAPLLDKDDSGATGKYLRVRDSNGK